MSNLNSILPSKILVNIEGGPSGCGGLNHWVVSLTIGEFHFLDNQYDSYEEALQTRLKLIEAYDNFEMGRDWNSDNLFPAIYVDLLKDGTLNGNIISAIQKSTKK